MPKKQHIEFEKREVITWYQSNISKKEIAKKFVLYQVRQPNYINCFECCFFRIVYKEKTRNSLGFASGPPPFFLLPNTDVSFSL